MRKTLLFLVALCNLPYHTFPYVQPVFVKDQLLHVAQPYGTRIEQKKRSNFVDLSPFSVGVVNSRQICGGALGTHCTLHKELSSKRGLSLEGHIPVILELDKFYFTRHFDLQAVVPNIDVALIYKLIDKKKSFLSFHAGVDILTERQYQFDQLSISTALGFLGGFDLSWVLFTIKNHWFALHSNLTFFYYPTQRITRSVVINNENSPFFNTFFPNSENVAITFISHHIVAGTIVLTYKYNNFFIDVGAVLHETGKQQLNINQELQEKLNDLAGDMYTLHPLADYNRNRYERIKGSTYMELGYTLKKFKHQPTISGTLFVTGLVAATNAYHSSPDYGVMFKVHFIF